MQEMYDTNALRPQKKRIQTVFVNYNDNATTSFPAKCVLKLT